MLARILNRNLKFECGIIDLSTGSQWLPCEITKIKCLLIHLIVSNPYNVCSVPWGRCVRYHEGYLKYYGGGGEGLSWVPWGYHEKCGVLNIPHSTDHTFTYVSRYRTMELNIPTVLKILLDIPNGSEDIPYTFKISQRYWAPLTLLNTPYTGWWQDFGVPGFTAG